jgi:hypothetical protein
MSTHSNTCQDGPEPHHGRDIRQNSVAFLLNPRKPETSGGTPACLFPPSRRGPCRCALWPAPQGLAPSPPPGARGIVDVPCLPQYLYPDTHARVPPPNRSASAVLQNCCVKPRSPWMRHLGLGATGEHFLCEYTRMKRVMNAFESCFPLPFLTMVQGVMDTFPRQSWCLVHSHAEPKQLYVHSCPSNGTAP